MVHGPYTLQSVRSVIPTNWPKQCWRRRFAILIGHKAESFHHENQDQRGRQAEVSERTGGSGNDAEGGSNEGQEEEAEES